MPITTVSGNTPLLTTLLLYVFRFAYENAPTVASVTPELSRIHGRIPFIVRYTVPDPALAEISEYRIACDMPIFSSIALFES